MEEILKEELYELKRILEIIGIDDSMSIAEAKQRVNEFKNTVKTNKPSGFQKFLDWLAQPVPNDVTNVEEANAASIIMKGYWEAIAIRDRSYKTDIHKHQHLHIHLSDDTRFEDLTPDQILSLPRDEVIRLIKYKRRSDIK